MRVYRSIIFPALFVAAVYAGAMTISEAQKAFELGDYAEAADVLAKAADQKPKDAELNTKAGIALFYTGQEEKSLHYLKRGSNKANLFMAQVEMHRYNFDQAEKYLDTYEDGFKKTRRAERPERPEATEIRHKIDMGRNMLERVEKIVIIDSIDVDRDEFFKSYRLSAPTGSFLSTSELPRKFEAADPTVVFVTEKADEIFWAMPDENEDFRIATSTLLADNTWETPALLPDFLNEGGDANYPFMMSDGVTLYYGNTGQNSLGGYDIFISRRDGESWYQPQNIGMPYNSYANDYLLAIDEITGAGWWATDRNAAPDRLTLYVFVPEDLRVNYPTDFPDLASRALITRWKDTLPEDADYSSLLNSINNLSVKSDNNDSGFRFAVPTRGVYTSLRDFRSADARKLMESYLKLSHDFDLDKRKLQVLREGYAKGNKRSADDILSLEKDIERLRGEMRNLANRIISAEIRK